MLESPPRLLIATTNPGKLREITYVLDGLSVRLVGLHDVHAGEEPDETGDSFAANALLKARYYCAHTRLLTVAEDSGLSIDALNGRPGVESARYPGATYEDKFANLYRELSAHRRPWTARFVCSLALVTPSRPSPDDECALLFKCEATVEGEIAAEPRGSNGFGYDPIFFYPPYGRTLGETDDAAKLAVAHRGRAFRQLRDWLTQNADRIS